MDTRHIFSLLINATKSALTGALTGYTSAALLSASEIIHPDAIIPITQAAALGNAVLSLIPDNNIIITADRTVICGNDCVVSRSGSSSSVYISPSSFFSSTVNTIGNVIGASLLLLAGLSPRLLIDITATAGKLAFKTTDYPGKDSIMLTVGLLACIVFMNISCHPTIDIVDEDVRPKSR